MVYARVTIDGKRFEISTKREIDTVNWDKRAGKLKGRKDEVKDLATYLEAFRKNINVCHTSVYKKLGYVTLETLKAEINGDNHQSRCVIDLFKEHNQKFKEKVGVEYALATLTRYKTTLKHVEEYIKSEFNRTSFAIGEVNFDFIIGLEHFLRTNKSIGNNTTFKYLKNFKKIILIGVKRGWIVKDPFEGLKTRLKPVKREALTNKEIHKIWTKKLSIKRLEIVRDLFLFSCYTGLSYVDINRLENNNFFIGVDGKKWLRVDRKKTKTTAYIPLLERPIEILSNYQNDLNPLPRISNQKVNAYLKEIADLCDISKNLHFHLARHTFATTVMLSKGISIESVSAMLGHKDIKVTQIYSKVTQEKISNEINRRSG